MFDIGFSEIFLFGVIALIVLGPEKLPQAARSAGKWYAKLRRTVSTIQSEIEAELDLAETRQQMQDELANIRKAKADMTREMAEMRGSIKAFESSQHDTLHSKQNLTSAQNNSTSSNSPERKSSNQNMLAAFAYAYESDSADDLDHTVADSADGDATKEQVKNEADVSQTTKPLIMTRPWENMWFRLGDYDRARRLPAPPYLPNYQADLLLYANSDTTSLNNQQANR